MDNFKILLHTIDEVQLTTKVIDKENGMDIPHNFYDDNGIFHCNLIVPIY